MRYVVAPIVEAESTRENQSAILVSGFDIRPRQNDDGADNFIR